MTKRSELGETISFTFPVDCEITYRGNEPTVVNYPTGAILGLIEEIMSAAGIGFLKVSWQEDLILDEEGEDWYDDLPEEKA